MNQYINESVHEYNNNQKVHNIVTNINIIKYLSRFIFNNM